MEAKEVYQKAKKNARRIIRQARNEEWAGLGKSLQDDFKRISSGFGRELGHLRGVEKSLIKCVLLMPK